MVAVFVKNSVHFTVTMSMEDLDHIEKADGLHKFFKLESSVSTTNMVLFDQDGQLTKSVYQTLNKKCTAYNGIDFCAYCNTQWIPYCTQ